ncbi:MAG: hypothetical protein AABY22_32795 [Nanoarchaeota archaeon]
MKLTKEQEDSILEEGMEDYYNKKSPYANCMECGKELKKEEGFKFKSGFICDLCIKLKLYEDNNIYKNADD